MGKQTYDSTSNAGFQWESDNTYKDVNGGKAGKWTATDEDGLGLLCLRLSNKQFETQAKQMLKQLKYLDVVCTRNTNDKQQLLIRATGKNESYAWAHDWQQKKQDEFLLLTWGSQQFLDRMLAELKVPLICFCAREQLKKRLFSSDEVARMNVKRPKQQ